MNALTYSGPDKRSGLSFFEYIRSSNHRLAFPWISLTGLVLTGFNLYDVYGSPENHCRTAEALETAFDLDFTGIMQDSTILCEALGLKIRIFDRDFPAVITHPVKNRADLSKLDVPDPRGAGRMPSNLQSLIKLGGQSKKPIAISVMGPFTLAGQLAGVEHLARILIRDRSFAHDLLAFTTATVKSYARAVSAAGADLICIGEPTAVILSSEQFGRYVVPGVREVFEGLDAWRVIHICGNTSHFLGQMLTIGAEGLSLDQVMDIPALIRQVPPEMVLFGNIDPIETMLEMKLEGVRREMKALLEAVRAYPNFIMSTGCDCPLETPLENIRCLVETTHDHPQAKKRGTTIPQSHEERPAEMSTGQRGAGDPAAEVPSLPDTIFKIRGAVVRFDRSACIQNCRKACSQGISIADAIQNGLAGGMQEAGKRFAEGSYFVPELLLCADALYAGLDILAPLLVRGEMAQPGRLLIGVIKGDIHEIGKNLVVAMFKAEGWDVLDLGADVSAEQFVASYASFRPDLVGISALMNTTMRFIPGVVTALKSRYPEARIMVGGAPFTTDIAKRFKADGYAEDASRAVAEGCRILRSAVPEAESRRSD